MANALLSDQLWNRIEPLLPAPPARPKGGRSRLDYRKVLTGILFVLKTGIQWEHLPQELGYGSGMTCWRRLRDWSVAGVWLSVWAHLHQELGLQDLIDWERALVDSSLVPAKKGALIADPTLVTEAGQAANIT